MDKPLPTFGVYVTRASLPKKKHTELSTAITEAGRLADIHQRDTYVIEYFIRPIVICRCDKDGNLEQLNG